MSESESAAAEFAGSGESPRPQPFPDDWNSALVLVPHPDDAEYGIAAAVAKWTAAGKAVRYVIGSHGEAGIEGMSPEQAAPVREAEQRRSARIVGVDDVVFWAFPDSDIRNTPDLRAAITAELTATRPDVVIGMYGGESWGPDVPNQSDHVEFAAAVIAAYDALGAGSRPRWLFEMTPTATHTEPVDGAAVGAAVDSLAAHQVYLSVLDPYTRVREQALRQVDQATGGGEGPRAVGFALVRSD